MHTVTRIMLLAWALVMPTLASAQFEQASIAGIVRDTSGAVLPGVTVEAASPALIEKVRVVVTDGTGQYRIVDLRPGTYTLTFTLPGFATVRREEIVLTGAMTATVTAELRVGSLEETITVTGESPLVDTQNARRQETLSSYVISAIPSARGYTDLAVLVPAMTSGNTLVGGLGANSNRGTLGAHGGASDGRIYVDGQSVGSAAAGNTSSYAPDAGATAAEVVVSTSAGSAEAEAGGPMVNIVSKTGGNTVSGVFFANGASGGMQGSNYSQALRDVGLRAPNELIKMWDMNGGLGGPVKRDRLWFFLSGRHLGNREYIAGMYYNKNAGDPTKWTYDPDFSRRAFRDFTHKNVALRLTWQATESHKFNVFWDEQAWCNECNGGGDATTSPEASGGRGAAYPNRLYQAAWTAPLTSRLLLEAGLSAYDADHFGKQEKPTNNRDLIRVVEQAGLIPGLTYRSQNWSSDDGISPRWRMSLSYVTGAHSVKVGYQGAHFWRANSKNFTNNHRLTYRFNNGVPNQLTMTIPAIASRPHVRSTALFAQDQWALGRVTLQMGLRYDYANSYFAEQQAGPERFLPVAIVFPRQVGVKGFHDLNPRGGVAYDVFGNGETALKMHVGRYVVNTGTNTPPYSATNPIQRLATSTTRSWNDRNGNFEPDCDLLDPAANAECGAWANRNFGRVNQSTTYDPALLEGWGIRQGDWFAQAGVQQQLSARVSVALDYIHRWFFNPTVTDNLLVGPTDYERFSITAPVDRRLPTGGGYVIDGLYDVSPSKFGATENFVTSASRFGDWKETWHGLDVSVTARLRQNLTAQGGFSTGRRMTDRCAVTPKIDNPSALYCRVTEAFQTQIKAFAAYTIPRVDVQVSGTFQSRPGVQLAANYDVPTAVVAQTLGRNLAGGERNVRVNLIEPGTLYGDQSNQLDFRVAKLLRLAGRRIQVGVDVYNALNSNAVQTYNQTYGPRWLTPTSIMPARFAKVGMEFSF